MGTDHHFSLQVPLLLCYGLRSGTGPSGASVKRGISARPIASDADRLFHAHQYVRCNTGQILCHDFASNECPGVHSGQLRILPIERNCRFLTMGTCVRPWPGSPFVAVFVDSICCCRNKAGGGFLFSVGLCTNRPCAQRQQIEKMAMAADCCPVASGLSAFAGWGGAAAQGICRSVGPLHPGRLTGAPPDPLIPLLSGDQSGTAGWSVYPN